MTETLTAAEIDDIARGVVRSYARKCWWADQGDLHQEARLAVLEARRLWKPDGRPFAPYAHEAAVRALRTMLWRDSSPVAPPKRGGAIKKVAGLQRAPLDTIGDLQPEGSGDVEEELADAQWKERVKKKLAAVLGTDAESRPARLVLLGEQKPAAVAKKQQLPVADVYQQVRKAKRHVEKDEELNELWRMNAG
jgi:hypothetical protein